MSLSLQELVKLWEHGEDVPIDEDDCIDSHWGPHPPGTEREEVWGWFETQHPDFSVGVILNEGLDSFKQRFNLN